MIPRDPRSVVADDLPCGLVGRTDELNASVLHDDPLSTMIPSFAERWTR